MPRIEENLLVFFSLHRLLVELLMQQLRPPPDSQQQKSSSPSMSVPGTKECAVCSIPHVMFALVFSRIAVAHLFSFKCLIFRFLFFLLSYARFTPNDEWGPPLCEHGGRFVSALFERRREGRMINLPDNIDGFFLHLLSTKKPTFFFAGSKFAFFKQKTLCFFFSFEPSLFFFFFRLRDLLIVFF